MGKRVHACKKDVNQTSIEEDLKSLPGISFSDTSKLGDGFPDLVVGFRNVNYLFEIKNPDMPPSKRKLTDKEAKFQARWSGQYSVCCRTSEILEVINYPIGEGWE